MHPLHQPCHKCLCSQGVTHKDSTTPIEVRLTISLVTAVGRYSQGVGSSAKPKATQRRIIRSGWFGSANMRIPGQEETGTARTNQKRVCRLQSGKFTDGDWGRRFRQYGEHLHVVGYLHSHQGRWLSGQSA